MALKLKSFETENGILIPEGYFKLNNISYITYLPDESDAVLVCDGSIYYNKETRNKGKQSLDIYISVQFPCLDKTINLFEYGYNKIKELVNNSTIEELENIDINLKLLKDATDC